MRGRRVVFLVCYDMYLFHSYQNILSASAKNRTRGILLFVQMLPMLARQGKGKHNRF